MTSRTLFAQIWRPMLVAIPLTFAINAFLVTGALDLGSEAQTERRLARIGDHWRERLPAAAPLQIDPVTSIYPAHALLPADVRALLDAGARGIFELGPRDDEYFVLAGTRADGSPYYVVEHHSEVKPSDSVEWRVFLWYAAGSLGAALLVLWTYRRVARRVAAPLQELGDTLAARAADSVAPVALPAGATEELALLVGQLNQALARIDRALDRERSFARYASHELRTPVAVMQAALERLEDGVAPDRQPALARARRGLADMHALIDTFLALARETAPPAAPIRLDEAWILRLHAHLHGGRPVASPCVESLGAPLAAAPETVLHVLFGNLLKNADVHGVPGTVRVRLDAQGVVIENRIDGGLQDGAGTGDGTQGAAGAAGHGLGTQIAQRICALFGWRYALTVGHDSVRATIRFD